MLPGRCIRLSDRAGVATSSGRERMSLDSPAGDSLRQDADPAGAPAAAEALTALLVELGAAPDLEPPGRPGVHALEIVDDERHVRVCLQVTPLLRTAHRATAYLDRFHVGVEAKAD